MLSKRVVITGLGVLSSNGIGGRLKPYEWGRRLGFKSSVIGQVTDFFPAQHSLSSRDVQDYSRYLHSKHNAAVEDTQHCGAHVGNFSINEPVSPR